MEDLMMLQTIFIPLSLSEIDAAELAA